MELKEIWIIQISNKIKEQKEKIHKKDISFFQIDVLEKLIKHTHNFSNKCNKCEANKQEITKLVEILPEYINENSNQRKEYGERFDLIIKHLKSAHNLQYKGFYLSLYSLFGFIIGILFFGLIAFLINPGILKFGILFGFAIGLIIGRIIGKIKERRLEKEKKFI